MEHVIYWTGFAVGAVRLSTIDETSKSYWLARAHGRLSLALSEANRHAPEARPQIMRMMNWVSAARAKINKETV